MTQQVKQQTDAAGEIDTWLTALVAQSLEISASQLDAGTHFARYGLDSISAVAIMTAISDKTGLALDEDALIAHPTIAQLARYIADRQAESNNTTHQIASATNLHEIMHRDSILPADIHPPPGAVTTCPAVILLTGATGFLGSHLLDVLLRHTQAQIYCLVRPAKDLELSQRLADVLTGFGMEHPEQDTRVTALAGDIGRPGLGLDQAAFEHLARSVDVVYHCAADVNWAMDYRRLRESNVLPVVDLLRLCSRYKKKHFVLVSSISVCYAYRGPATLSESNPALPLLDGIYLGYAQSKVIAETLCEQALARGLPVTIHRPALILGNSITGRSNNDDLVSRVIKGCIAMGYAPDLDWPVDACPVNEVAAAIYNLSIPGDGALPVSHLLHPRPRYWRELVLWMNVHGYPVELLPYPEWADRLRAEADTPDHPLYPLRPFFLQRLPEADGLTLPELYEEHRRSRVTATQTDKALSERSLGYTPLDSALLERYFEIFTQSGFLPRTAAGSFGSPTRDVSRLLNNAFFMQLAPNVFHDADARIVGTQRLGTTNDDSIITDLASWRFGKPSGLFHYRITAASRRTREVFIKVKPDDTAVLDVATTVAELSARDLGTLFSSYRRQTGLAGCHKRELAVYRQTEQRFVRHVPRLYLAIDDDETRTWLLALEAIERPVFMDTAAKATRWSSENITRCIDGLAELHSIWLGREDELINHGQLCNVLSASDMKDAQPLWFSVARQADRFLEMTLGDDMRKIRDQLVESVHDWWLAMESLDRTLVHNDFNPRNIAIADRHGQPVLCAFDWELAALGLPQRDLVELLCFTLPPDHDNTESMQHIEHHRQMLEQASGSRLDPADWLHGLQLALYDLIINRIPMYTLIHRIRPQGFLPRVTQTWHRLFREYGDMGSL